MMKPGRFSGHRAQPPFLCWLEMAVGYNSSTLHKGPLRGPFFWPRTSSFWPPTLLTVHFAYNRASMKQRIERACATIFGDLIGKLDVLQVA